MTAETILGIVIPFFGTSLGAAMVFVLKKHISDHVQKLLTGFAAGVVVAASFWSLLAPALESSEAMGTWSFVPAAVGFLVGVGFLLLLDEVTPHLHFIVSMPLRAEGMGKGKTFLFGVLSGVVEPIAAAVTVLAAEAVVPIMPYLLAFAAGAMMYVVVEELIPEMSEGKHTNLGTIAFSLGFVLMMVLDVALG